MSGFESQMNDSIHKAVEHSLSCSIQAPSSPNSASPKPTPKSELINEPKPRLIPKVNPTGMLFQHSSVCEDEIFCGDSPEKDISKYRNISHEPCTPIQARPLKSKGTRPSDRILKHLTQSRDPFITPFKSVRPANSESNTSAAVLSPEIGFQSGNFNVKPRKIVFDTPPPVSSSPEISPIKRVEVSTRSPGYCPYLSPGSMRDIQSKFYDDEVPDVAAKAIKFPVHDLYDNFADDGFGNREPDSWKRAVRDADTNGATNVRRTRNRVQTMSDFSMFGVQHVQTISHQNKQTPRSNYDEIRRMSSMKNRPLAKSEESLDLLPPISSILPNGRSRNISRHVAYKSSRNIDFDG
eukprot:792830_1